MAKEETSGRELGSFAVDRGVDTNESASAIGGELLLVMVPLVVSTVASELIDSDRTDLVGGVAIAQGPLPFIGMLASLGLLRFFTVRRGAGWEYFGLQRPTSWPRTTVQALAVSLGVLVAVVGIVNPVIRAMDLPDRDLSRLDIIEGDLANLIANLVVVWVTAAFIEELLFRGYLINRFVDLQQRASRASWAIAVVGSSVVFGLPHIDQGAQGMIHTGSVGLVFGIAFLMTGRKLWPLVLSHGLIDTLDFISHYFEAASAA